MFLTYYKESFTKNKIRRLLEEFKAKSACKIQWTPMDLRHSFAVNFLRKGGDTKRLQYLLGHKSVFNTRRLYAQVEAKQTEGASPYESGSCL